MEDDATNDKHLALQRPLTLPRAPMNNFVFQNATKLIFGRGTIGDLASELPPNARVLVTYGGGSIKRNGVWDQVMAALSGHHVATFGGIPPNPTIEVLNQAVAIAKRESIDFLLAVGGGSVADGTKYIAAAAAFEGDDPWDLMTHTAPVVAALPLGVVLTLPATGSESNAGMVITRAASRDKLALVHPLLSPQFAVLDPETTFSLPERQTANGVVDAFVHVMEQYLTYPVQADVQDRYAEALLKTLIDNGPRVMAAPDDYDARANMMWAACQALNGLIGVGVPHDWATHMIGHELTALHGLDHAQTLAIVLPRVMDAMREGKAAKLLQYGERVWGITDGTEQVRIDAAIARTEGFFVSLGVGTRLDDYNIGADAIPSIVASLERHGFTRLGESRDVTPSAVTDLLTAALTQS